MRILSWLFAAAMLLPATTAYSRDVMTSTPINATVTACFVPEDDCVSPIVAALSNPQIKSIRVQAYGFTSPPILKALIDAKQRGADVQVILDKINAKQRYSGATTMLNAHIPTYIDTTVAIAHSKIIVIDGHLIIGGSYNYTLSAEKRNAENVTFIESPDLAKEYLANWDARKAVSVVYTGLTPASGTTASPPANEAN